MGVTNISASNPLANKQFSKALAFMATRAPTPLKSLMGDMPSEDDAMRKLQQQSSNEMPIVRVDDLSKGPGTTVQLDCGHVVKLRAIMGDRDAEGKGATLAYSSVDVKVDMATLPVSAGGKMTQQRTPHRMRQNALGQLKGGMPRFRFQRALTQLCGARGAQDGTDWILPLASDPEFLDQMINPVQAPTYNRHYVVDGGTLVQGGLQLNSVDSTDLMRLSCIDELAALWDEMAVKMAPIQIPGDDAAGDDMIKGVLLVDNLVWDAIVTEQTSGNNIRTWQQNALDRAAYGKMGQHPLFAGRPLLWNGVIVKKMGFGIRFNAGDSVQYVPVANRLTAAESTTTIAAGLGANYQVARSVFLGAQALAFASGGNQTSGESYSLLENTTNFGRNLEMAGEIIGSEQKLRWALPTPAGLEPTDFGALVIDSVVRKRST